MDKQFFYLRNKQPCPEFQPRRLADLKIDVEGLSKAAAEARWGISLLQQGLAGVASVVAKGVADYYEATYGPLLQSLAKDMNHRTERSVNHVRRWDRYGSKK